MNATEFDQWFTRLVHAIPKVADHFTSGGSADEWKKSLSEIAYRHADEAIDEMLAGKIKMPWNNNWHELPGIVQQFAYIRAHDDMNADFYQGWDENEPRIDCNYCMDSGFAIIWNPLFVKDRWDSIVLCNDRFNVVRLYLDWRNNQKRNNPKRVRGGYGALSLAVVCSCEHPVAKHRRHQISEWRDKGMPSDKVPRPCYSYRPEEWHIYRCGEPEELK